MECERVAIRGDDEGRSGRFDPLGNDVGMSAVCAEATVYSVVGARRVRAIAGLSKRAAIPCSNPKVCYSACYLTRIG